MPRRMLVVVIAVAGLVVLLGAGERPVESRPPAVQWVGSTSGVAEAGYQRVLSLEAWRGLWEAHMGDAAERAQQGWVMPPEVDFERYMVVACFRGPDQRNNGERASAVFRRGGALVIRFDSVSFQTSSFGSEPEPDPTTTPYGMWVVEREEGVVVIEEDRNGLIGADPVWREAHRFEPAAGQG